MVEEKDKLKCVCLGMSVESKLKDILDLVTKPLFRPKWKEAKLETGLLISKVDQMAKACDYPQARYAVKAVQKAILEKDIMALIDARFKIYNGCKEE